MEHLFCPQCGGRLERFPNNAPVADFFCAACREEYELKSTSANRCARIPGGAYSAMIRRLLAANNPNLILLSYDRASLAVRNVFVVPRYFFTPELIRKRAPLAPTARRAGWVGCTIEIAAVPETGRVFFVTGGKARGQGAVLDAWSETQFLRNVGTVQARGWLVSVMRCIERLRGREFTLADLYAHEDEFQRQHPGNQHIREKLRQQLQVLRDKGRVQFLARGRYRWRGNAV